MATLSVMTIVVPVVILLGVLWALYDRECALALTVLGVALLALWGHRYVEQADSPPGERLRELLDLHGDDLSAQRVFFGHLCGSMCAKPLFSKLFQPGNNFGGRWKPR